MTLKNNVMAYQAASERFRVLNITVTMTGEEWEHLGHLMMAGSAIMSLQCINAANTAKFGEQLNHAADKCGLPSVAECKALQAELDTANGGDDLRRAQ